MGDGQEAAQKKTRRKPSGRVSASFTRSEISWLESAMSVVLCPTLDGVRTLSRSGELPKIARKVLKMREAAAVLASIRQQYEAQQRELDEVRARALAELEERERLTREAHTKALEERALEERAERARRWQEQVKAAGPDPYSEEYSESIRVEYIALIDAGCTVREARKKIRDRRKIGPKPVSAAVSPSRLAATRSRLAQQQAAE